MVRLDAELKLGKRGSMVPSGFPGLSCAFAELDFLDLGETHNRENQAPILSRLQISPEKQGRFFLSLITNFSFDA